MKMSDARQDLAVRAEAALKAALAEVSTIKVKEIRHESLESGLTAYVDVFGRGHTLACEVHSDGQPTHVRSALAEFRSGAADRAGDTMPVLIAPYLSPEAQALCKESKMSFVDLEGNVRLALGEVFIVKRTMPTSRNQHRSTTPWTMGRSAPERLPVASVGSASQARRAEA